MKLGALVKGYGDYEAIRDTYSDMTMGQIMDIQTEIAKYIQEEVIAYVETQEYPKTQEDIHRNIPLLRVPEHLRLAIVQQLDELMDEKELLVKFELYMIMVSFVGDQITAGYKSQYDKAVKFLQGNPDINLIHRRNMN